jgi:hypothetical protein
MFAEIVRHFHSPAGSMKKKKTRKNQNPETRMVGSEENVPPMCVDDDLDATTVQEGCCGPVIEMECVISGLQGTYTGDIDVVSGLPHGTGCFKSIGDNDDDDDNEGHGYTGEWEYGRAHGHGVFMYADGDKYAGEFRDNKRHGQGVYTHASGDKYNGEYRDDKRHGHGVLTNAANGSRETQEWWNGTLIMKEIRSTAAYTTFFP